MKKIIIVLSLVFLSRLASAEINMGYISTIESSNRAWVVSDKGAIGLYQITPIVLKEYNLIHKTAISKAQLFDAKINAVIAHWYMQVRIPEYLTYYKIPHTDENKIIAWNWGIGNLVKYLKGEKKLPVETSDFIKKYKRLCK